MFSRNMGVTVLYVFYANSYKGPLFFNTPLESYIGGLRVVVGEGLKLQVIR